MTNFDPKQSTVYRAWLYRVERLVVAGMPRGQAYMDAVFDMDKSFFESVHMTPRDCSSDDSRCDAFEAAFLEYLGRIYA